MFANNALSKLCEPFSDEKNIMSIARPIAINDRGPLGKCIQLNWDIHHILATIRPKGTELLAFRKTTIQIPKTTVDEEYLLALLSKEGNAIYSDTVCFFNKGPTKFSEFISQIRRNCTGHLFLIKETGYVPITAQSWTCVRQALLSAKKYKFAVFLFLFLQCIGRSMGFFDYMGGKKDVCWSMALSTKDLTSMAQFPLELPMPRIEKNTEIKSLKTTSTLISVDD